MLVQQLDVRLSNLVTKNVQEKLRTLKECCQKQSEERKAFEERIVSLERITRESNLIFSNVCISSNPIELIRDVCIANLGLENISISKVFKLKEHQDTSTAVLLVFFHEESYVNRILQRANRLKGTRIGLSRDIRFTNS